MAAKVATGSVRKAKPFASKTSLNSPYGKIWKPVIGEDMHFVLLTIMEKFKQLGLRKIEIRMKSKDKKTKKSKKMSNDKNKELKESEKSNDQEVVKEKSPMEVVEEGTVEQAEKSGWTHSDLRKHLAIGINEVTRSLERNDLYLVIVCKSAKPEMITKHIIELSASRQVPAGQLPRLSENIAPVLGLKSVMALGFKKSSDVFLEEVKTITPRLPPVKVNWLPTRMLQDSLLEEDDEEQNVDVNVSRKRKLPKTEDLSNITFQELQVKKIVPNPNKKRKIKNKKKVVIKK